MTAAAYKAPTVDERIRILAARTDPRSIPKWVVWRSRLDAGRWCAYRERDSSSLTHFDSHAEALAYAIAQAEAGR